MANTSRQEISRIHGLIAKYYWLRHFEINPVNPAGFFDRIMMDYAHHESDVVGHWIDDMSPLYKSYRACLNYGVKHGTPKKQAEAAQYQGVTLNKVGQV